MINVTANGDEYTFKTTNLLSNDRVFYRFSDGCYLIAQNTGNNDGATVTRRFPNTTSVPPTVIGYIAKKNGPLGIATLEQGSPQIMTCTDCQAPQVGLGPDEYIRLVNSWLPFTNTQDLVPMLDNTTVPAVTTPAQPWLLLAVTMKYLQGASYVEVSIPAPLTCMGAIAEEKYGLGTDVANAFIGSVTSTGSKAKITLAPGIQPNKEFTVYLMLAGAPTPGMQTFEAQMKDNQRRTLTSSDLRVTSGVNPHDPNRLTAFESYTCAYTTNSPPLQYRVDFQNTSVGVAHDVKVAFQFNPAVLDPGTVSAVAASGGAILTEVGADRVTFYLKDINLPGIEQTPQPAPGATEGWVNFSIEPRDCIPAEADAFFCIADVTFIARQGDEIYFQETVQTNKTVQKIEDQCPVDPKCLKTPGGTGEGRSASGPVPSAEPKCAPTLFNDHVALEGPASERNEWVRVVFSDLSGKRWMDASSPLNAGEAFRQRFETAHLPAGMYLVQLTRGGRSTVFKIMKTGL